MALGQNYCGGSAGNSEELVLPQSDWAFLEIIACGWLTLIIGTLGLFGNGISVAVLAKLSMRTTMDTLLLLLTACDFLGVLTKLTWVSLPTVLNYYQIGWTYVCIFVPVTVPIGYPIMWMLMMGSSFYTLLVTSERYFAGKLV